MNKKERMLSATSYALHVIRSFYFIFKRSFLRKEKKREIKKIDEITVIIFNVSV
ncbi:hypothetical protein [Bacillus cereus]|uniref:hypothetical protein n=1 Tax=Bacillus cereus TaxID=1396 RepID=UPI0013C30031|nr:hypothetical protein [Bacillus cereus]